MKEEMKMNRFDEVKAVVRDVPVEILALGYFDESRGVDPRTEQTLYTQFKLKKEVLREIVGLTGLTINLTTGETSLDFTGKFLPKEYRNLINKENILKYIEHINKFGFVRLDAEDFLKKAKVRSLHSTVDIKVEEPPTKYLNYLHHLVTTRETAFEAKRYKNGNIDLKRKTETNRQPVTVYDKHKELKKQKNALLRELLGQEGLKPFRQVIRFEQKLPNTREIYQAFNIISKDNSLLNILHSDIYPVVNTLNTLFDSLEVPNVG